MGNLSYRFLPELGRWGGGLCWSRARPLGSPRAVGNSGASLETGKVLCMSGS